MADRIGKDPRWISIDAAADYCGLSLSDYVALSKTGVLPAPFQPGLTLIDCEALDRALDRIGCGLEIESLPLDTAPEREPPDHCDLSGTMPTFDEPPSAASDRWHMLALGLVGVPVLVSLLFALLLDLHP